MNESTIRSLNLQRYFEFKLGTYPIVLSCPHGGFKTLKSVPVRSNGVIIPDKNVYILAKALIFALKEQGIPIYYIVSKIHRKIVDLNRPPRSFVAFDQRSKSARRIHRLYHKLLQNMVSRCVSLYNRCLLIDLHGFSRPHLAYPDIIFGNIFGKSLVLKTKEKGYWGFSDIISEVSKDFKVDDGLGITDFNLAYSGGYITHQFYKREKINAFQLEIAKYIRYDLELTRKLIDLLVAGIMKTIQRNKG